MDISKKRIVTILCALVVILMIIPFVSGQKAHAMANFELDRTELTFTAESDEYETIAITKDSCSIKSLKNNDPDIFTAVIKNGYYSTGKDDYMYIWPLKEGTGTMTVTGVDGTDITVTIIVKAEALQSQVQDKTYIRHCWYGTKKLVVESINGASGTVKVGKDKYKFSVGSSGKTTVKLKKVYPLNTKVKLTAKCGIFEKKVSEKLTSWTQINYVKASKKKLKLTLDNVHKGDVVKVTYKGKTYTKKIKKDKDNKTYKTTITVKNSLTKKAKLTLKIVNKDKKTLFSEKVKLKNWEFDYNPEPDDDYTDPNEE